MSAERTQILKMVESGKISAQEAIELLNALNGVEPSDEVDEVQTSPPPAPEFSRPERGWLHLASIGLVVMAVGAPLVALGLTGRATVFWALLCGWGPFLSGLAILTLGVWARNARWLHLRVSRSSGRVQSLVLSFPLPLTLAAWLLSALRSRLPWLQETGVDETILALREGLGDKDGPPIYLDVSNDDGGEHVQVHVG
jgi:hypothetical protein